MNTDQHPCAIDDDSTGTRPAEYTATYSPEDNKLRLRSRHRLSRELYDRLLAVGFHWAPVQKLFVAPKWTPEREDVLLELCEDIEDEDTTLVDRAEERADRFEVYEGNRSRDAEAAHRAVEEISGGIPLGQPILVGHHSERHARRDAERIENGMRRAVRMWQTARYWESRAAGVLRHAKYKERPEVRARRIRTLEAEQRTHQRRRVQAEASLAIWTRPDVSQAQALFIAATNSNAVFPVCPIEGVTYSWNSFEVLKPDGLRSSKCPSWTVEQVRLKAQEHFPKRIEYQARWIDHYDNRLLYERALLEEQGASDLLVPRQRPKPLPLCNYRAQSGLDIPNLYDSGRLVHHRQVEMTQAEYARIWKDYKGTRIIDNSHRIRTAYIGSGSERALTCIFLTDKPVHPRPAPVDIALPPLPISTPIEYRAPERTVFDHMAEQLSAGVTVVSAEQLFPTPRALARRMTELATGGAGCAGRRVLEPSAGTGVLLDAIIDSAAGADCCRTVAVEINHRLAAELERQRDARVQGSEKDHLIVCRDFLVCGEELGRFDCILMNPPFANAQDIDHVSHALSFLKAGGRLIAIMSAGVTFRQDRRTTAFRDLIRGRGSLVEPLPEDTFSQSGTNVRTILVTING